MRGCCSSAPVGETVYNPSQSSKQDRAQKVECLSNRNRTSDRWMAGHTQLQSTALPTELSREQYGALAGNPTHDLGFHKKFQQSDTCPGYCWEGGGFPCWPVVMVLRLRPTPPSPVPFSSRMTHRSGSVQAGNRTRVVATTMQNTHHCTT